MKHGKTSILFLSQYSHKIGYGHLKRSELILNILKNSFKVTLLPYSFTSTTKELIAELKKHKYDYINIDFRYYDKKSIYTLSSYGKLILWDALSLFPSQQETLYINPTTYLHYNKLSAHQFYYSGLEYLPVPPTLLNYTIKPSPGNKNIFICFGNSDPHQLSLKILRYLKLIDFKNRITLNIGSYFKTDYKNQLENFIQKQFTNFLIIKNSQNIIPSLWKNEYIISSFSISALEALMLSKKVALYDNSLYHTSLTKQFDQFHYLGTYPLTPSFLIVQRLKTFFSNFSIIKTPLVFHNHQKIKTLYTHRFTKNNFSLCPVCKSKSIILISNQFEKKIYHCLFCHSKFQYIFTPKPISRVYHKKYFTDKYKKQYGKTYLEDKKNIEAIALNRLSIIKTLLKNKIKHKRILDIGCAYGFFLAQAEKFGFITTGLEIEKNAFFYARNTLHLKIIHKDFEKVHFNEKYDVITLWYVFEHFKNPEKIIKKISSLLTEKGLLCLSLPNGDGPFFHFNRKDWLEQHPEDHYFDYSIKGLKIFVKKYGFQCRRIRITGYHPERYHGLPKIVHPFLGKSQQGDTMELYFQKSKSR